MKKIITLCAVSLIVGCSSTKSPEAVKQQVETVSEPLAIQKLSTTFNRQGVKFEWHCVKEKGFISKTCENGHIKAIEVTAYASSNGNSENARELAFRVAESTAKAKLRHFINEDIYSSRVITTLSKNIEKANDRLSTKNNGEEVAMSDEEARKDTNYTIRENSNNISRNVVEVIRLNAQGILRGVYTAKEEVVDRQTVMVTIRWDQDSAKLSDFLRKQFGT